MTNSSLTFRRDQSAMISHNLVGQRLGRKGAETRERVVSAMLQLLEDPAGPPVTLTSVAREANVGLTTLYLYFPDLADILLAALKRVMDSADEAFMDRLAKRWPDDTLGESCLDFLQAHLQFWKQHGRLLHMRNSFADACDARVLEYRHQVSWPLIDHLVMQMDGGSSQAGSFVIDFATVVLTGLERMATVVTNPNFHMTMRQRGESGEAEYINRLIIAEARLIELAIRRQRAGGADGEPVYGGANHERRLVGFAEAVR